MQSTSTAVTVSIVGVVDLAVTNFILAIECESLGGVQRCAEGTSKTLIDAFWNSPDISAELRQWTRVIRTLAALVVSPVLSYLQRLRSGSHFGSEESACESALISLLFCTLTLCRSVRSALSPSHKTISASDLEDMRSEHWEQRRRLCVLLSTHFSLLSYTAEQQLWQMEVSLMDMSAEELPAFHTVPRAAAALSRSSGWIWLLVEATTGAMCAVHESEREKCGLTETIEAMDPQDPHNAPFARKLADILLSVFAHFMRRWMAELPGLPDAIRRVEFVDADSIFVHDKKIPIENMCRAGSSEEEMWTPIEMCILLRDLLERVPVLFATPSPALRLLRVVVQISAVRLYIAARHPTNAPTTPVLESFAAEFLQLLEAVMAKFSTLAESALLPSEANLPCLQMALFLLAGSAYESTICEINVEPVVAVVRCAFTLCLNATGAEADKASTRVIFTQSFILALGETFAHMWNVDGYRTSDTAVTNRFFRAARLVLHHAKDFFAETILTAADDIMGVFLSTTEDLISVEPGTAPPSLHQSYWLLALLYLRMANIQAQDPTQKQQRARTSISSSFNEHNVGARWFCGPAEELQRLRGEEPQTSFPCSGLPSLHGRLLIASRRFLLIALYEAIQLENLFLENRSSGSTLNQNSDKEINHESKASEYYNTYMESLLLMENTPAEEVTRSSSIFYAALVKWRRKGSHCPKLLTEIDVDATRRYQLAECLFHN